MQKTFLKGISSFFVLLFFLFTSCNSNDSGTKETETADKTTTANTEAEAAIDLTGNLDTLYMLASNFPQRIPNFPLTPRLTFRFFDTLNTFTLHGWVGMVFNDAAPSIRLSIGRKSSVQYGSGSYFGNLILRNGQVGAIKDLLTSQNATYVIFAPEIDVTGNFRGQIFYRIFYSYDNPQPLSPGSKAINPTGQTTNPSPPRNTQ